MSASPVLFSAQHLQPDCEFIILGDINADDVETCLAELREEDGIGYRTYNHYLQAIEAWCNWMATRPEPDCWNSKTESGPRHSPPKTCPYNQRIRQASQIGPRKRQKRPVLYRRTAGKNLHPFLHDRTAKERTCEPDAEKFRVECGPANSHSEGNILKTP